VFRGILVGCLIPPGGDFRGAFYGSGRYPGISVFDPFMGSGTTVGEAHKLGCTALGMDINPVACESVRVSMGPLPKKDLLATFDRLSEDVGGRIRSMYASEDEAGERCDVLYFFWVKQVPCPSCGSGVDLFPSYVFARNARPDVRPGVHVHCPGCGDVLSGLYGDDTATCSGCSLTFDPRTGPARGAKAVCTNCSNEFSIVDAVKDTERPPAHRLYAKLILTPGGRKRYLRASDADRRAYSDCSMMLKEAVSRKTVRLPSAALADGHNTRQAINYNYREWKDFFNDRQLLALGWLHGAILKIEDEACRDAMLLLFSGILEFNNMFASYKGEGTGAVRHMFSHHILKPERVPIEANVWGTEKSSGSFANLFRSRLLRGADYRDRPFELSAGGAARTVECGRPFSGTAETSLPSGTPPEPGGIYLSCGSSDDTGMPGGSVDYVVTDPPFFDNVHYSELADFFYSWQGLHPHGFVGSGQTTRDLREVQDSVPERFSEKLCNVFAECRRILKDDGLLAFTYHHSRPEGWISVAESVRGAGFATVNAHPVKSEMSVAAPKSQSRSPIQLDTVFVCKKRGAAGCQAGMSPEDAARTAGERARRKAGLLRSAGLDLSRNDVMIILYGQFLASLGTADPDGQSRSQEGHFARLDPVLDGIMSEMPAAAK